MASRSVWLHPFRGGVVAARRSDTGKGRSEGLLTASLDGEEARSVAAGTRTMLVAGPERAFHNPGDGLVVALVLSVATVA